MAPPDSLPVPRNPGPDDGDRSYFFNSSAARTTGLTSATAFQSVHHILAVYSPGLQASKHDHPDYGDADLNANQKVHKVS